ncbi:MAG: DUF1611 domain-containing protein [Actinomycetota bacterium]|nr:DUF1611 domain-containing protein [Actinomycetota bacterium]
MKPWTYAAHGTKAAYTTRHVRLESAVSVETADRPDAGDLVLARVTEIGQHKRLELPDGRRAALYEGDEIVVAYGNRYAPDQFEAVVPEDLGPCHLVAAGGIAATILSQHTQMEDATCLEPLGLLVDADGRRINLRKWCLPQPSVGDVHPWTIVVTGSSMNAGKTTTAAAIIRGLSASGRSVAAGKVTGTGAGGDVWLMSDAGANPVLDFTAAGFASTYLCTPDQIERSLRVLHGNLAANQPDAIVLEIADGLLQRETSVLLGSALLADVTDAVVFAACDALSAVGGVGTLRRLGLPVVAVSGVVTASPLATRETQAGLDLPVLTPDELISDPSAVLARQRAVAGVA